MTFNAMVLFLNSIQIFLNSLLKRHGTFFVDTKEKNLVGLFFFVRFSILFSSVYLVLGQQENPALILMYCIKTFCDHIKLQCTCFLCHGLEAVKLRLFTSPC